jgi:hypothetical protein
MGCAVRVSLQGKFVEVEKDRGGRQSSLLVFSLRKVGMRVHEMDDQKEWAPMQEAEAAVGDRRWCLGKCR